MTPIKLQYTIVGIRNQMPRTDWKQGEPRPAPTTYGYMIVDLLWSAQDGSPLRDDDATEIPDQVEVPNGAGKDDILAAIERKKKSLYEALAKPGVGITIAPDDVPDALYSLIGTQG